MNGFTSIRSVVVGGAIAVAGSCVAPCAAWATGQETNATITVFAAASATDALTALAKQYETNHAVKVRFSFASSSVLARQIEQDAPCDVFLSADERWMDYVAEKHKIRADSRKDILGNRLVFVTPANKTLTLKMEKGFDLAGAFTGRLAIGDPDHVPAGTYAKEAFQNMGWWDALKSRLAPTENVRAALKLVELGEVDAGVVYLSDAKSSSKVAVAAQVPETAHKPIRYPVALCLTASPEAGAFLSFVAGKDAAPAWIAAGFIPLAP